MTKKEKIILFYYEQNLNTVTISNKLKISQQYVSKVIQTDERYISEKIKRKEESKLKQRDRNINCIKNTRAKNKARNERLDAVVEILHRQASCELSGRKTINNRAFKKWNSSIYEYHSRSKEYRIKEKFKSMVSYAAPKKIKWD